MKDLFVGDRPDFRLSPSNGDGKPKREPSKKPEVKLRPDVESVIVACCDLLKKELGLQKRLLETRGITLDTARRFGIGYDGQRARWSIPIRDHEGVCAVGLKYHRATEDQEPKAVSETGSQVDLFGLEHLTQGDPVVITEGEFDAMAVWQSTGINAVSGSGGAGTVRPEWADLLAGHPVTLFLDNDSKGKESLDKWGGFLGPLVNGGNIPSLRVVSEYPAGCKDATDILLKHGPAAVQQTIDKAISWKPKELDDEHSLTDHGNAIRFKNQHGTDVRYCFPWDEWLIWDGKIWERDKLGKVFEKGKQTVRKIYSEAEKASDPKRIANHANRSNSRRGISDMLILARSTLGIPILPEHLDTNPWIFNCQNGTYDLQNHTFYDHRREDYQTRMAPVTYNEKAVCPTWEKFLETIFQENKDLIDFMQRVIGYSLTGDVGAQKLFLLHGESGANGKTVLLKTVMGVMGPYATRVESDLLLSRQYEQHPTGKCDLFGARLALCSETGDGRRMAESLVKEITGGDTMKGRRMRQDFFSWEPSHKIFLLTNDKPVIQGRDDAIWRRIDLIPFNYQIPAADRIPNYERTLLVESSGIFNWALRGLRSYQDVGLMEPETVTKAVDDYRESSDHSETGLPISVNYRGRVRVPMISSMRREHYGTHIQNTATKTGMNRLAEMDSGYYLKNIGAFRMPQKGPVPNAFGRE